MGIWSRGDEIGENLVHHSDRGVQYTSIRYAERLGEISAVRSVGRKGDSYDNAAAEALNGLYKIELIERDGPWSGTVDIILATLEWLAWYNREGCPLRTATCRPGNSRKSTTRPGETW
jgi:putative transposase